MTLEQAIDRALESDAGLQAAGFERSSAEFRMKQAESLRYPVISLNAKARFIDEVQSISTPFFTNEIGSKENYQIDASLSVPLYTGGKISGRIDIAANQYDAVDQAFQSKRMETAHACRRAYFSVLAAQAQSDAVAASRQRIDVVARDVRNLYGAGMADSLDILEADLAVEQIQLQMAAAATNQKNAAEALKKLIGEFVFDIPLLPLDSLPKPRQPQIDAGGLAASITRPELRQLEYLEQAAQKSVTARRAGYFPDISTFAGYSYGKPNQDIFNKSWNDYFSAGVVLSWDFNIGGETRHGINEARAAVAKAKSSRKDLEEMLLLNARTALNRLMQAYDEYEIVSRELRIARKKYELAEDKRSSGALSVNRLIEIEAELTSVEKRYDAIIASFYMTQADFLYAIGSDRLFGGVQ